MTTTTIPVTTGVANVATVAGGYGYLELAKDSGPNVGQPGAGATKLGVTLTGQEALAVGQALVAVALELLGAGNALEALLGPLIAELKDAAPPIDPDDGLVT